MGPDVLVEIDRSKNLTRQIYRQIRQQILSGNLAPGRKLPSSRRFALDLHVSRNIVLEAFDQLIAEGFLETRPASGTFVATGARYESKPEKSLPEIRNEGFEPYRTDLIDFRSGLPELSLFPVKTWLKLAREVYLQAPPSVFAYGRPEGRCELREAVAAYAGTYRGVKCHPDQVLITAGTTQAIGILTRLLLRGTEQRRVLVEDPLTVDIKKIISGYGGTPVPVPVDNQGLRTAELPEKGQYRFCYVTPSHQYPLGGTMPIQRRLELLQYARKHRLYIVEDDYDSEFRFDGPPVSSIQGLEPERVIYIGTFSKTLNPSLRTGYIIFPANLIEQGRSLKWFTDLHNATVEQLILARFINEGYFVRHISRMKKTQYRRRLFLEDCLKDLFGDSVEIMGSSCGLHLSARFQGRRFDRSVLDRLEAAGIKVYPVSEHSMNPESCTDCLILGYGMLDEADLKKGTEILKRELDRY